MAYVVIGLFGLTLCWVSLFVRRRTARPSELRIVACILVVVATLVGEWLVHDLRDLPKYDHVEFNFGVH